MDDLQALAEKYGAETGVGWTKFHTTDQLRAFVEAVRNNEPSDELQAFRRQELVSLMRYISEDFFCAGWYSGLEYILWEMVSDPKASRDFGMGIVSEDDITKLRTLAEQTGGWWRWHDERDLPAEEWGERFTPMADWLVMYERHRAAAIRSQPQPESSEGKMK